MPAKKARKRTTKKTKRAASLKSAPRKAKTAPRKAKRSAAAGLTEASPAFTVNDLERSMAWYRDVLGFSIDERWERDGKLMGVSLKWGKVTFMIGQDDWQKGRDRKKGEGFRIYCGTNGDVDAIAAGIKARGGVLDTEPMDQPWGSRDFAISDPDGFKITIGKEAR